MAYMPLREAANHVNTILDSPVAEQLTPYQKAALRVLQSSVRAAETTAGGNESVVPVSAETARQRAREVLSVRNRLADPDMRRALDPAYATLAAAVTPRAATTEQTDVLLARARVEHDEDHLGLSTPWCPWCYPPPDPTRTSGSGHQWVSDSPDDEGPPEWMCSRRGCAARLTGIADGCVGDILAAREQGGTS